MGNWLAVTAVVALVTGCNYGAHQFACASDEQCKSSTTLDGLCQLGQCSFPDSSCENGRRYGDVAGGRGECVGALIDAGVGSEPIPPDVPIDARICFGTAPFAICLSAPPSGPRTISTETKIDTSVAGNCAMTMSGAENYCVIAATTITINARLRGIGNKPLVLLASESITVTQEIDVGNHRGDPDLGAGANPTVCQAGSNPGTRGGGSGGSFTGTGGTGGNGGGGGGAGGMAVAGSTNVTTLRGGCAGHDGNGAGRGAGGRGGGAVYLLAGTRIDITGAGVKAGGEGGGNGAPGEAGGGGGGSGGMILLDAPTIACTALLLANGGGGGEGSDQDTAGDPGSDATETAPADGGGGLVNIGGNGGDGSAGAAAGPGANANSGIAGGGPNDGGGGGGGGGAGLIRAPANASLGTSVSPAATRAP